MVYPYTPFDDDFNTQILTKSQSNNTDNQIQKSVVDDLLKWLCSSPYISTYRVNTLTHNTKEIYTLLQEILSTSYDNTPNIEMHPILNEVIIINNLRTDILDLKPKNVEVIVDVHCAAAVLRGAHIFAPGILGMQSGSQLNDQVSVYADIAKKCKKGFAKIYERNQKVFIGNGIVKMVRNQLFGENLNPQGIAIEMYSNISGCPNLRQELLPQNSCLLQNFPSIVCGHVLSPQRNEVILDMCASPGNKTTHIAQLMHNMGTLIALDKTPSKVKQLKETCDNFKANVTIHQADSTKICTLDKTHFSIEPPFSIETFDRILLDAPCSALGKRPQFYNNISEKVLKSYVPLQRKLFENAVKLLKVNGRLVYSTCTITLAENEGIVAWALKTFKCLDLVKAEPYFGSTGWPGTDLTEEQLQYVQRFDNNTQIDSVGFFIASFVKNCTYNF